MNRYEISELIVQKYGLVDFDINNLEKTLLILAPGDYVNKKRRVAFPLLVLGIFGRGTNALVLEVQDAKEKIYALRISQEIQPEGIFIQEILAQYAMAPELLYVGKTRAPGISFCIIDRIQDTLENHIMTTEYKANDLAVAIKCLLDKKYLLNFIHGDMHIENIVILNDGLTLGFIDFDWSFFIMESQFTFLNILDFIPFLYTLKVIDERMAARAKSYYETTFKIKIDWNRFERDARGGIVYNRGIFSYIKNFRDGGALDQIARSMIDTFPSLTLPEIVD